MSDYKGQRAITPFREMVNTSILVKNLRALKDEAWKKALAANKLDTFDGDREFIYYDGVSTALEELANFLERFNKDLVNRTDFISGMEEGLELATEEFHKFFKRVTK